MLRYILRILVCLPIGMTLILHVKQYNTHLTNLSVKFYRHITLPDNTKKSTMQNQEYLFSLFFKKATLISQSLEL